jgi:hypothetical protein
MLPWQCQDIIVNGRVHRDIMTVQVDPPMTVDPAPFPTLQAPREEHVARALGHDVEVVTPDMPEYHRRLGAYFERFAGPASAEFQTKVQRFNQLLGDIAAESCEWESARLMAWLSKVADEGPGASLFGSVVAEPRGYRGSGAAASPQTPRPP